MGREKRGERRRDERMKKEEVYEHPKLTDV